MVVRVIKMIYSHHTNHHNHNNHSSDNFNYQLIKVYVCRINKKKVMQGKYINPFTDFGFKKIFAEEASKPLLIDFLNALLNQESKITDITFKNTEKLGLTNADRKAVYDIFCDNNKGEKFIVELQKLKQNFFKDRTVYYSTFPIVDQAEKGEWDYQLNPIYCIGILGFTFDSKQDLLINKEVVHTIKLKDQNNKVFYEKLTFIYLEMPNFSKKEDELETRLDKWLFFIKNLEDFQEIPAIFGDSIFESAFEKAELAKYNDEEHLLYQASLKTLRDNFSAFQCATDEGKAEGIKEGIILGKVEGKIEGKQEGDIIVRKVAKNLKDSGMAMEKIIELTGLMEEEINEL